MPLFQACVLNYSDKAQEFFNIDVTKKISQNFLTLSANYAQIDDTQIRSKYSPEVAKHLLSIKDDVNTVLNNESSPSFAITINHKYFITKKKNEAEATIAVDNNSEDKVKVLKVVQDPNNVYKYSANKAILLINQILSKNKKTSDRVNTWSFPKLIDHFEMRNNDDYTFTFSSGKVTYYKYSFRTILFLAGAIESNEHLINDLHENKAKK